MSAIKRWFILPIAVLLSAAVLAACGGDDDTDTTTAASGTTPEKVTLAGGRTIGVIPSEGASEFLKRQLDRLETLMDAIGWELKVINPNGDPAKMNQAADTFISQKVDAIFTIALGGEEVADGLAAARKAGIPTIAVAQAPTPGQEKNYSAVFGDGNVAMGEIGGEWITQTRGDIPTVGLRLTQNFAGDGFIQGVEKVFEAEDKKFQDLRDTNLTDIINSMTQLTQAIVQKNKGELTMVDFSDFGPSIMTGVFDRAKRDDITILTRYDNASTVKLMRDGAKIAFVSTRNYQHVFDAVSALLAHWEEDKPFPAPQSTEPDAKVFTVDDLPENANDGVYPFDDDLKKQVAEWHEKYGDSAAS